MQRLISLLPKLGDQGTQVRDSGPRSALKVFKFGSSILRTPADLPRVAGEIYRQARHGERIIAVVSALEGETDGLLAACSAAAGDTDCAGIAEAVSLGEEKAAALLKIACDRIGLAARVARPEELGIRTQGKLLEAVPCGLVGDFARTLASTRILIVPGFTGVHDDGRRSLLGRGGTDFSAIYLGGELEADLIRLYKDVDGVFDHDPADTTRPLLRFDHVSWDDCLTLARPLLQPRAVEYAKAKAVGLEVGSIGTRRPTFVGPSTFSPDAHRPSPPLRLALAGYGTVGQALAERLALEDRFEIAAILVRDITKCRRVLPPVPLTDNVEDFLGVSVDVVIDLNSCAETGLKLTREALRRGQSVVSASKVVVGKQLRMLEPIAAEHGGRLLYSAAVGGSSPVIETVRLAYSHGDLERVDAILNGTVNYLLDQVASGAPYALALRRAQAAGFAEEDPSQDLAGRDAELKLRIIAAQIAGPDAPVDIEVEPLDDDRIADIAAHGERWIQHSSLTFSDRGIEGSVRIRPAAEIESLAAPAGERNVASIACISGRRFTATGRGAGGAATAEAVTADLFELAGDLTLTHAFAANDGVPERAFG